VVAKGLNDIFNKHEVQLRERELLTPYQYLHYADIHQDLINGYGQEVKTRLQNVSKWYDHNGAFQKQISGGFKLFK
jgi:hypothetical protein